MGLSTIDLLNKVETRIESRISSNNRIVKSQPNKMLRKQIDAGDFQSELRKPIVQVKEKFVPSLTTEESNKARNSIAFELLEMEKIINNNILFLQRTKMYKQMPELENKTNELKDIVNEYRELLIMDNVKTSLIRQDADYEINKEIKKEEVYFGFI